MLDKVKIEFGFVTIANTLMKLCGKTVGGAGKGRLVVSSVLLLAILG